MKKSNRFEIVDVSDEYMAVPVGEEAENFKGVVALSEPAAFLLKNMEECKSKEELIELVLREYDVDRATVTSDVDKIIQTFLDIGLIDQ